MQRNHFKKVSFTTIKRKSYIKEILKHNKIIWIIGIRTLKIIFLVVNHLEMQKQNRQIKNLIMTQ